MQTLLIVVFRTCRLEWLWNRLHTMLPILRPFKASSSERTRYVMRWFKDILFELIEWTLQILGPEWIDAVLYCILGIVDHGADKRRIFLCLPFVSHHGQQCGSPPPDFGLHLDKYPLIVAFKRLHIDGDSQWQLSFVGGSDNIHHNFAIFDYCFCVSATRFPLRLQESLVRNSITGLLTKSFLKYAMIEPLL